MGKFNKTFWIPTIAAGVLGLGFLCVLIALIAVAASPCKDASSAAPVASSSTVPPPAPSSSSFVPPPPVSSSSFVPPPASSSSSSGIPTFKEFSATVLPITCDSFGRHCVKAEKSYVSAFGIGKFCYQDKDDNGEETWREFSAEADETCTSCEVVNDHYNCYNMSADDEGLEFSLDGLELVVQNVSCSVLASSMIRYVTQAGRSVDKCDYYVATNLVLPENLADVVYQVIVETGTNYPVIEYVKDFGNAAMNINIYLSFDPHKPEDESCMKPYPNVTIYDFRDNDGDSNEKPTFTTRKRSANVDMIAKNMERRKKVRQIAQIPIHDHFWRAKSSKTRKVSIRDPRDIPSEFDARTEWSYCGKLIGTITNQDYCGSCWAMSGSAVLADRSCIANASSAQLSPQYMVYCGYKTFGCQGGGMIPLWDQLMEQGTVTEECIPFTARDGFCPSNCMDGTPIKDNMKVYAKSFVTPWDSDPVKRVQAIQTEIMERGSVQAAYIVFSDFYDYESGVYQRTSRSYFLGLHAVRVVGWGTDNGVDYWLVANSWDTDWGMDGFFKIRRGTNECNFEEQIVAGLVN